MATGNTTVTAADVALPPDGSTAQVAPRRSDATLVALARLLARHAVAEALNHHEAVNHDTGREP
jgi:hypothetical protein